jgi:hypothetical protein
VRAEHESSFQKEVRMFLENMQYQLLHEFDCNIVPINPNTKQKMPFDNELCGVYGKNIIKMAPIGLNGGVGAGSETGVLPSAKGNRYAQFKTTLKNLYGQIAISDKAIRASSTSAGAFVDLLNAEMEGLLTASKFNLGRMLYGDGSGALATVTATSGNTITFNSI